MKAPPSFILLRHGQTALGAQGRFQGHLPEALDETGMRQADEAGSRLAGILASGEWLAQRPQIVTSTLPRAIQTAMAVARHLGVPGEALREEDSLCEMAFGPWEGLTTRQVKERFPDMRRARKLDRWNFAAPGGESYRALAHRVENWLEKLDTPVIVVTHCGTMRVVGHLLAGWSREDAMARNIAHCEMWCWKNNKLLRL